MRRAKRLLAAPLTALMATLAASTCGPSYPTVDCQQVVWVKSRDPSANIAIVGSWDDWQKPGIPAVASEEEGWRIAILDLPPGEYGYQVVVDGVAKLDPFQPLTTFRGDREVSLLVAADCRAARLDIASASADASGAFSIEGTFSAKDGGSPLDPKAISVTVDGAPFSAAAQGDPKTGKFTLSGKGLSPGKHAVSVESSGAVAKAAVWVQPAAETWDDAVLYQIVVDRYRGDGGAALAPPATPGTRAGGTLAGVTAEIEKGTFTDLGVTALWISPVYTNPDDFRIGRDGHPSEGYHGYWPVKNREVDPKIGGEAALDALMAAAHQRGIRVLFDLVPNHVYETNPLYTEHRKDGWFNEGPGKCVCGDPGCDWGTHIESCWFTSFLPDVRWQDADAMKNAVDDALFWMSRFDADGVRIDAVPMMQRAATRRILRAMRGSVAPKRALFGLGEVYTGPGIGGIESIRFFMGPDGLDSAFDFPLMWAMRDALAHDRAGFDGIEATLAETEKQLAGSGAVMARMLGNHDTSRFASEANGDAGNDGWSNPPPQPTKPEVYARQRLALALTFALPGMPVIYYGDEIGLAGASDPDSRRVMPALDSLSADQQSTLATAKRLGALRRCSKALRRGARDTIWYDAFTYAFKRDTGDGDPVLAVFSRAPSDTMINLPGGVVPPGEWIDALAGQSITIAGAASIPLAPLSAKLLVRSSSPCRPADSP
jgi:glycosidase